MALDDANLDFAYRYPFSGVAKGIISKVQAGFESKALHDGGMRVQKALDGKLSYERITMGSIKLTHLISYIYARMVASSLRSPAALKAYASAEAHRSAEALLNNIDSDLLTVSKELGMHLKRSDGLFTLGFEDYLSFVPRAERFSLAKQMLKDGIVYLDSGLAVGLLEDAFKREVLTGLPIPQKDLPKEVAEYAKSIKVPDYGAGKSTVSTSTRYAWIEKLLANPIPDVRHRSVNLILAPYLVNVRGMDEEQAVKAIEGYIEKCKELNPHTSINITYIRYQCKYAKNKGLRPLSLERARELIGMHIEI